MYVSSERVKPLPITLPEALRNIRTLGKGLIDIPGQAGATDQDAKGDATAGPMLHRVLSKKASSRRVAFVGIRATTGVDPALLVLGSAIIGAFTFVPK